MLGGRGAGKTRAGAEWVAGEVAAAAGGASAGRGTGYWVVTGLGLLATVVVTTLVNRTARRALREEADDV